MGEPPQRQWRRWIHQRAGDGALGDAAPCDQTERLQKESKPPAAVAQADGE